MLPRAHRLADMASSIESRLREIEHMLLELQAGQAQAIEGEGEQESREKTPLHLNNDSPGIRTEIMELREEETEYRNLLIEVLAELHAVKDRDIKRKETMELGALYPENWRQISQGIKQRDSWHCRECGASDCVLHVHHKRSLTKGGTSQGDNLVTLCESCHASQHPHMM